MKQVAIGWACPVCDSYDADGLPTSFCRMVVFIDRETNTLQCCGVNDGAASPSHLEHKLTEPVEYVR